MIAGIFSQGKMNGLCRRQANRFGRKVKLGCKIGQKAKYCRIVVSQKDVTLVIERLPT